MTFGQKIYFYRTKMKLTQAELAKLTGVNQSSIAQYENGDIKQPKADALLKLASVFKVKPEILMNEERSVTE